MRPIAIFWHRRDLRLHDNAGLYHALKGDLPVLPLFIFDGKILNDLADKKDARVEFIHQHITQLHSQLEALGSTIRVEHGSPAEVWKRLLDELPVGAVYTNHDYEPYALQRDEEVRRLLAERQIPLHTYKDHVIFERQEVVKDDGLPYTVFTPYSRKWRAALLSRTGQPGDAGASFYLKSYPNEQYFHRFASLPPAPLPSLESLGFERAGLPFPSAEVARSIIRNYDKTRDIPGIAGTSRLGVHFRFGTISIREKARHALSLNDTYLNELIWRDFYAMILSNFPHIADRAFRPEYEHIEWRQDKNGLQRWRDGLTGYPLVDAGMRELAVTGYMHNRVRMVTASFLTKHLLIDWRLGEAWFAQKLLDFDLASNSGGWQWAAGCGTDAAPYFRVFNPTAQQEKFDPDLVYIRRWIPEYGTSRYPQPIVEHKMARERCLEVYKAGLGKS
ncbi:MAG TPA: deoxyribodipyrimidine photo-lyase [Saprospiraceae bacterium]|nr:deoxyribodipyrimidine photo-lyase [Saprospiraceae bacterium]